MIHKDPDKECKPDMDNNAQYNKFHKIYKNLYNCLKEQYKEIAKL